MYLNKASLVTTLLILFFGFSLFSPNAYSGSYSETLCSSHLKFNYNQNAATLTIQNNKPINYKIFGLDNPPRVVIDLKNTNMGALPAQYPNFIRTIRKGYPAPKTLRLVIDVTSKVKFSSYRSSDNIIIVLNSDNNNPSQNNMLVKLSQLSPAASISKNKNSTQKTNYSIQNSKKQLGSKAMESKKLIIIIDPGHGGKDPGAIGQYGTKEKHVVLPIAKRLAYFINQQPDMKAILTRRGDYFVTLRQRLRIARRQNADVFISIHADSFFNNYANGVSVYTLSHRGASSEAARWIAQRENYSELCDLNFKNLGDQSHMLRSVLIDLAQTANSEDSYRLGTYLLNAVDNCAKLHKPHVEQAPFVVLKSPDIPSVLVETGFISNLNEEMRLRNPDYQNKLAYALFCGLKRFLNS